MRALSDLDLQDMAAQCRRWGAPPSHALRLLREYYRSGGRPDLAALKLGKILEHRLGAELPLRQSNLLLQRNAEDGTVKLLIGFATGGAAESVLIPAHDRRRAAGCVSSQIGCAMGCNFCASTRGGLERNLSAGEIVEQFLHLREQAAALGRRLSTLVFMGMGEPMHNLDEVMAAVRRIAGVNMGELGARHITISTVGIVPGIDRLAEADLNVHLALSLHAPDDETRARLVPSNRRYGVGEIMAAAQRFQQRTGRVVNVEYCALAGVNDSDDQARMLAALMAGFRAHVNLIPYNPIGAESGGPCYEAPSPRRVEAFVAVLRSLGVVVHVRRPRGQDVNAACGQLRRTTLPQSATAQSQVAGQRVMGRAGGV